MRVSLNIAKQFIDFELPPVDELVAGINAQLGRVEEVVDVGAKYKDAKIVRVVECEPHPNADRLSVCKIDAGMNDLVQVVCGAPNVHADMWAVWLPPDSTVPSTAHEAEPFVLGARELRGVMSHGMLAAGDELGINGDHDGIIEITARDVPAEVEFDRLTPGQQFAEVFGLDDTIIDIENKMFTHRPDLFGQLGVAREIAGIFGQKFDDPQWYYQLEKIDGEMGDKPLETFNESGDTVPRFMAVVMDDVSVGPSPLWLQARLTALGAKPINNVVDVTNYTMLLTAQPTHAYDYDKIRGHSIGARMARDGESIKLLNGKTYQLTSEDIVIADAEGPVGLGGIMGGGESEVSANTKTIVLEVATFDMYTVRKTSMRHGVFTDALTRFNKGQSMLMNPYIMQYTVTLMSQFSSARAVGEIHDDLYNQRDEWRARPAVTPMLETRDIDSSFINKRLGLELSVDDMMTILGNVGFECGRKSDDSFEYFAPAWRMDIQDKEDVVEEIGRLYGFDKLPRELPTRTIAPAPKNSQIEKSRIIRQHLVSAGANEVLTYSFVHRNIIEKAGQTPNLAYCLSNALSPDLQYYRLSILPSLLDKVHSNIKAGYDTFALYEIGKSHRKGDMDSIDKSVPRETSQLALVTASNDKIGRSGAAFFQARKLLGEVVDLAAIQLMSMEDADVSSEHLSQMVAAFDPRRSAVIIHNENICGVVGEFLPTVTKNFKLPRHTAGFEISIDMIDVLEKTEYRPLSKFPSTSQDLSLRGSRDVAHSIIENTLRSALARASDPGMRFDIQPTAIYVGEEKSLKTETFHLVFERLDRTLKDEDANLVIEAASGEIREELGFERV